MPRKPRPLAGNTYYHIFNRGVNKQDIFWDDRDRQLFLRILSRAKGIYGIKLFAFCLMSNHYHLFLWTQESNLHRAMQLLQSQYVQYINLRYDRVGHLFQGRYQLRAVEADPYSLWLIRYIHRNPAEAVTGTDYAAYTWSSYRSFMNPTECPNWLDANWVLSQFHSDPALARQLFAQFHNSVHEGFEPSVPRMLLT